MNGNGQTIMDGLDEEEARKAKRRRTWKKIGKILHIVHLVYTMIYAITALSVSWGFLKNQDKIQEEYRHILIPLLYFIAVWSTLVIVTVVMYIRGSRRKIPILCVPYLVVKVLNMLLVLAGTIAGMVITVDFWKYGIALVFLALGDALTLRYIYKAYKEHKRETVPDEHFPESSNIQAGCDTTGNEIGKEISEGPDERTVLI